MNNERLEEAHVQKRLLSSSEENSPQPRPNKNWLEGMCEICASIKLIWKCFESSSSSFLTPLIGFLDRGSSAAGDYPQLHVMLIECECLSWVFICHVGLVLDFQPRSDHRMLPARKAGEFRLQ